MEICTIYKENGRYDLRPMINWLSEARDGVYRVEVTRETRKRTLDQNAWLWGCIYPLLRQGLVAAGWEDMTDDEDVHEYFKALLTGKEIVNRHTGEVVRMPESTSKMNTEQFAAYCERLREFGREYLGVEIPDPINETTRQQDNKTTRI